MENWTRLCLKSEIGMPPAAEAFAHGNYRPMAITGLSALETQTNFKKLEQTY